MSTVDYLLNKPVVLVTGANTGIGIEIVKALCSSEKSYSIILSGRSEEKVKQAVKKVKDAFPKTASTLTEVLIDVEDDVSIQKAFEKVSAEYDRVDAIINNAGAQFDAELLSGNMTMRQAWNKSWDVNVTGSQVLTATFVPLLLKSSDPRLLFLTSGTASLEESFDPGLHFNKAPVKGWPKPSGWAFPAYRSCKVGLNMMMREWERMLREDGVKVFAISPGFLATGLGGNPDAFRKLGAGEPSVGGNFIKDVIDGKRDHDAGKAIRAEIVQKW